MTGQSKRLKYKTIHSTYFPGPIDWFSFRQKIHSESMRWDKISAEIQRNSTSSSPLNLNLQIFSPKNCWWLYWDHREGGSQECYQHLGCRVEQRREKKLHAGIIICALDHFITLSLYQCYSALPHILKNTNQLQPVFLFLDG